MDDKFGNDDLEQVWQVPNGIHVNSFNTHAKILSQLPENGRNWYILKTANYPSGIIRADEYTKLFDKKFNPIFKGSRGDGDYIFILKRAHFITQEKESFFDKYIVGDIEYASGIVKAAAKDFHKRNIAMRNEWRAQRGFIKYKDANTGRTLTSEEVYTKYDEHDPGLITLNNENEVAGAKMARETGLTDAVMAVVGVLAFKNAIKNPKRTLNDVIDAKDKAWEAYQKRNGKLSKGKWDKKYDTIKINRAKGLASEKEFQKYFGGSKPSNAAKTRYTNRHIDNLKDGVAREVKTGNVKLKKSIKTQIKKDKWLLENNKIKGVEWHFYDKPSDGVLKALSDLANPIKAVFHF